MASAIRKIRFSVLLALSVLVAHPVITFWLTQTEREKGPSQIRDVLWSVLFFPSTVFDSVVRLMTHKSTAMVFGGFMGDLYFGFMLNAVVWALAIFVVWLMVLRLVPTGHLTNK